MKTIKKLIIFGLIAIGIVSCNTDQTTTDNESLNLSVDLFEPQAKFDTASRGVYVGSVISVDLQYHAKIMINAGNNGSFSAKATINDVVYDFNGSSITTSNDNLINFSDIQNNASFNLNTEDYKNPQVTDFSINGVDAHMVLEKSSSNNRADVLIGSYTDVNDPTWTGAFDVFTAGEPHPYNPVASKVTRVTNVAPGGAIFSDTVMEPFDFAICTEDPAETSFEPLMFVNNSGSSAHFYADNQTSIAAGEELTWQIFHFMNDGYYIQFENIPGFADGCYETATGLWGWNGRYGVINFEFFSNAPEVTESAFSSVTSSNDAPLELTSDIIQAILND